MGMERARKHLKKTVFIDTHIMLWLLEKRLDLISSKGLKLLESFPIVFCPIIKLELQYLYEIKKIQKPPRRIIDQLTEAIGLQQSTSSFNLVIQQSIKNTWTRDPFDRIITADAQINNAPLITADKIIRQHYRKAF